jgi:glycosyltransferase involved in cell wall biosynthesis
VTQRNPRVLVAHPYPDLYGADLMLLRSLEALQASGSDVLLVVPEQGPLLDHVQERGIPFCVTAVPVLRKALLSPSGVLTLTRKAFGDLRRLRGLIRDFAPDVVYVNTLTLPHWLLAARLERVPSVCHVRELESQTSHLVATGLTAPLLLAGTVVANSEATRSFLLGSHPRLAARTRVVYNGYCFPEPSDANSRQSRGAGRTRRRLTVVGRLSPRKGQDVAVQALGILVAEGHDVELELVGSVFRGYEWFERQLSDLARDLGVADRLVLQGFQPDVWPYLAGADVVAVPSRLEPFGSVAAEALAAGRPVVVSAVGGLPEIVSHDETGLVVPPDDAQALAGAVGRLLTDDAAAAVLAESGFDDVRRRFPLERYERELVQTLRSAAGVRA